MTSDPISARGTMKQAALILNEFYRQYFNGQLHKTLLGDVTPPNLDDAHILFNQTQVPDPDEKPQIHTVFTDWREKQTWSGGGNLSAWEVKLAVPASGVEYGLSHGAIEEAVNGKLQRKIMGTDIRWQAVGPDFVEQVYRGGWVTTRTFPALTSEICWVRQGGNYVEQANVDGTWTDYRVIAATLLWEGAKKLVQTSGILTIFVRANVAGDSFNKSEFVARNCADSVKELFESQDKLLLAQRGIRNVRVTGAPRPVATAGYATYMLTIKCELQYFVPRSI